MKPVPHILIIKPGAIGDLLQLTPVLRALNARFPSSPITLLVGSRTTAELFRNNPRVHATIVYDKRGEHRSPAAFLRIWNRIRKERFGLVLNFQRSNLKLWLLAAAAFPCRVHVYHKSDRPGLHAVVNYLETIEPLGISAASLYLELYPAPEDRAFADSALAEIKRGHRPVIALNPGASHPVNRWSTTRFAELADLLAGRLGANIVLIGGKDDEPLAEAVLRDMRSPAVMLTGRTSLLQLGAVLEQCDILVTGDTGPMHIATAVGTRVVALFGAADPERTGPLGRGHRVLQAREAGCVPCRSRSCNNSEFLDCMKKIRTTSVFAEIERMLQEQKRL